MNKQEEIIFDGVKFIREDLIIGCTTTERAFLDEIRQGGYFDAKFTAVTVGAKTEIWQSDFPGIDIKDLVE
jgi:hypothetical protein